MKFLFAIIVIALAACTDYPQPGDMRVEAKIKIEGYYVTQYDGEKWNQVSDVYKARTHAYMEKQRLER